MFVRKLNKKREKGLKQHCLVDGVFLLVFLVSLFVPMMHISKKGKSVQENRMLAHKPRLVLKSEHKINLNYPKEFEAWYSDRFYLRDTLLLLWQLLGVEDKHVLQGKDNWLFYTGDHSLESYANQITLSEQQLEKGLSFVRMWYDFSLFYNKKFYYFVAPDKNKIYGEYLFQVNKEKSDEYGLGFQFYNYIKKYSNVNIIYPYQVFNDNKKEELLYYKNDTHWSDYGAFLGYKEIEKYLLKEFLFSPLEINDWLEITHDGDLGRIMGKKDGMKYKSPDIVFKGYCEEKKDKGNTVECYNEDAMLDKNLFVLGDSYSFSMMQYYRIVFKKVIMHLRWTVSNEEIDDIIKNYDVIIVENVERYLPKILN